MNSKIGEVSTANQRWITHLVSRFAWNIVVVDEASLNQRCVRLIRSIVKSSSKTKINIQQLKVRKKFVNLIV